MSSTPPIPPSRWQQLTEPMPYAQRFSDLIDSGADIDGEARLIDAIAPRHARILDAGAGMGRVTNALRQRGHDAIAVEPDSSLVAIAQQRFPDLPVLPRDILELSPQLFADAGLPTEYDVICLVGNVMIFLAEDSEREALTRLRHILVPQGHLLIGFHLTASPHGSRLYPVAEFIADATASGLAVEHHFGGYDLAPPNDEYAVFVLRDASAPKFES